MTRVKKRSGQLQDYDRTKLIESIKRAGADEKVAKEIAEKTFVAEGAATLELRKRVADELRKTNPAVAEAYERTLRLPVKARDDVRPGAALVPKRIERVPEVKSGQPGRVRHGEKRTEVRVEPMLDSREVWLSRNDLAILGVPEGTRVAVRFLPEGGAGSPPSGVASMQSQPAAPVPRKAA